MTKYCEKCDKQYDPSEKKCPVCGKKLIKLYTEEEKEKMKKEEVKFENYTLNLKKSTSPS